MSHKRERTSAQDEKSRIRKPPAYQEYAADVLADLNWRLMSLAERGLWDTLRKECWVNVRIPCDPDQLAKLLNLSPKTIATTLTDRVLSYFQIQDGWMECPELEAYRLKLDEKHVRMSEGGRRGGEKTQMQAKNSGRIQKTTPSRSLEDIALSTHQATLEALQNPLRGEEPTRGEGSRPETISLSPEDARWVAEFEEEFDGKSVRYGEHRQ